MELVCVFNYLCFGLIDLCLQFILKLKVFVRAGDVFLLLLKGLLLVEFIEKRLSVDKYV